MLERYRPQRSLRDRTRRQQLQPSSQDYSDLLKAQIEGAQKRRLRQMADEAQRQADSQTTNIPQTTIGQQEASLQPGGTAAELGIQTPPKRKDKRGFLEGVGDYIKRADAFGAGLLGKVAAEEIRFTKNKTFGDILSTLSPYSSVKGRDVSKGGLINTAEDLGKQLNEKGVSYGDILSGLKIVVPENQRFFGEIYTDPISGLNYKKDKDGNPTNELTTFDEYLVKYNETDLGVFEGTGPILEGALNTLGMSTQNSLLENFGGIVTQGKTTGSPEKLRGAITGRS